MICLRYFISELIEERSMKKEWVSADPMDGPHHTRGEKHNSKYWTNVIEVEKNEENKV